MSNMIRQLAILLIAAALVLGLDFSAGSGNFIRPASASDTQGPEISPVSLSITSPDQALQLKVSDPSGAVNCSLSVQGIEGKTFTTACKDDLVEIRVAEGWPRGAHQLRVQVSDRLGNQTIKNLWVVVAPAPPGQLQRIFQQDEEGSVDASQFPLAIYHVHDQYLPKVKSGGFNLAHHYWWEISPDNTGLREYLDAAEAAGLKLFIGFDRGVYSGRGLLQMNLGHLAERVAEIRDHPALLAWYLFDEPDRWDQYLPPRDLKVLYSTLKQLDPYHPVIVTFALPEGIEAYGEGCYDIYWAMVYNDTEKNDQVLMQCKEFLGPDTPFVAINSSFDEAQSERLLRGLPLNDEDFTPTQASMRADAYLALAHGSSGVSWWWYGDNRMEYVSVGDTPLAWDWLSQVVEELNQLAPMLDGSNQELPVQVEAQGATVRARAVRSGSQILIIAVNTSSSQEAQVSIRSQDFPSYAAAVGKFATPGNQISNQELRATLPPLAAYAYEVNF